MSKSENPILLDMKLNTGEIVRGVRVNYEAPQIAGFLAIEGEVIHTTRYIALSAITSFSVVTEEAFNILGAFPTPTVKTKDY